MMEQNGVICPYCGEPALARIERDEPVMYVGRDLGWDRRVAVFQHEGGGEHIIPIKAMFRRGLP